GLFVPRRSLIESKLVKVMRNLMPNNSSMSSPSKHGDRFNPSHAGANWSINFHKINHCTENERSPSQNGKIKDATSDSSQGNCSEQTSSKDPQTEDKWLQPSTPENMSLFGVRITLCAKRSTLDEDNRISLYSLAPVSSKSQKFLLSPWKLTRKIAKIPLKVLDAPELQDDFYLNLVDWSALNVLSRLRHLSISGVTRLCDLAMEGDSVTSVGWSEGNHVAVGTHKGYVQIWDAAAGKKLFTREGHTARVGECTGMERRPSERRLQESHSRGNSSRMAHQCELWQEGLLCLSA
uniref:Fizzy and cell division cycle 20 related 1 n=1 Tax=Salmo trutta TaxID=8032 RepID=A0A673X1E9_SALTR